MPQVKEYEPILKDHADVSQFHPCLFGGALPEGIRFFFPCRTDSCLHVSPPYPFLASGA